MIDEKSMSWPTRPREMLGTQRRCEEDGYVNGCIDELQGPASDKISEADCNVTCTGSKQQAMNCILSLQCSMSFESDTGTCRLQQGCD